MTAHLPTARLASTLTLFAVFAAACGGTTQQDAAGGMDGSSQGSGSDVSGSVRIDGSSTVAPFGEVAAELFMGDHPGVTVTVGVSGTGGGFEKFCRGETDVSQASRPIKDSEVQICQDNGIDYEEITVALDGLVNVVPASNDFVDCLSVEELNAIWQPESTVTSWADVRDGLPDVPLDLYGAGTDSGTFDYFTEAINGEEGAIRTDYNASEDDNVTVQGVAGSDGGLGFFGLSYAQENAEVLRALAVDDGGGCVEASVETVQDGSYSPLSRPLFMYASDVALQRPEVVSFFDYVIANEPEIAQTALFVPLTDAQLQHAQQKVDSLRQ